MIRVTEIAFTAYPVVDRARARHFYERLLQLKPTQEQNLEGGNFWIEYELGADTFALSNYWEPSAEPRRGPTAAFEVLDFEASLAVARDLGSQVVEMHESPVCFGAMVTDPDGNSLWLHKRKPGRRVATAPEVAFVCYPVTDKPRACDFYDGLLGLAATPGDYTDEKGFWREYETSPTTLAIGSFWKPSAKPSMGPSIAFEVENFETAIAELKARAIPFHMEPMETPICHLAVVTDPDGNSLFLHKRKPGNH